eukprot:CAMPEP_0176087698 /NCGR_PEP_ID=MMETSP0120_2-20121206/43907_1 /TAXON_ID=160619 /ORGANISM="Kryptoperidinium foliaceum, Strain CCMP 1326" /LENGTH=153 /DNA_ID=CAMNT_0017421547 /DNA_START=15 /DNA_END=474 /DNA_ORIENTATION=-
MPPAMRAAAVLLLAVAACASSAPEAGAPPHDATTRLRGSEAAAGPAEAAPEAEAEAPMSAKQGGGGGGRAAGTVATAGPTGAVAAATPVVGRKAIAAPTITALARSQRPHRRRPRRPLALALPMVASAMSHGTVASATAFAGGSATVALTSRR